MKYRLVLLAIVATPLLAGCQSIFGISLHTRSEQPRMAYSPEAGPATQAGRAALESGNYGAAIESFIKALGRGESRVAAINGLGVAYAKLERFDLAYRYFSEAVALEPDNERYAANFSRLMATPAVAAQQDRELGKQMLALAEPRMQATATAATAGKLVRSGTREFTIDVGEARVASARLAMVVGARNSAPSAQSADQIAQPRSRVVMVETAPHALDRFKPIVSIALPQAAPSGNSAVRTVGSPREYKLAEFKPLVRINLTPAGASKGRD